MSSTHIDDFVVATAVVGVPEKMARALVGTDMLTVTIEVVARFNETLGPDAGRPL
jgi:phosphatidate phosphatase APP1